MTRHRSIDYVPDRVLQVFAWTLFVFFLLGVANWVYTDVL